MTVTATAENPTEASASIEASATLLAAADGGTGNTQETQNVQDQATPVPDAAASTTVAESAIPTGAPENYAFTAPEGSSYDPTILEAFTGAAKEADLSQDAAQKLIEKMAPAIAARQLDQVKAIQEEWRTASSSDKEFGGDKLMENLGVARRAMDAFDPMLIGADGKPVMTPLRTLLEQSGLGNHPEFLRLMFRAGTAISEDKFVGGRASEKADPLSVLYPSHDKEK